jgi:transmembrane sensor
VIWSESSQSHKEQLFEVAELFDDLSALNELSGLFPLKLKEPIRNNTFSDNFRRNVAAVFALMLFSSFAVLVVNKSANNDQLTASLGIKQVKTDIGEQKPISLDDGSVIHLNTDSLVTILYSNSERRIVLTKGEAHFDVAHDEQRPFVVEAGGNTVTAVGTAFNVELKGSLSFELLVTEGKVLVKDKMKTINQEVKGVLAHPLAGEGILMASGEKAVFNQTASEKTSLTLSEVQQDLAWQQGMLVFQGESLVDALSEVSRYTPIKFQIADENVRQKRVAGYFKAGDIDGLLFALKNSFNIQHRRVDDSTIELSSTL